MLRFFSADKTLHESATPPPLDAMAPAHLETATFAVG
jgi:hypothetical protein